MPAARQRDFLFEALCTVGGHDITALTKTTRGALNRARKELAEVGASADDVVARAATYRRLHPEWDFTVPALVRHWDTLVTKEEVVEKHLYEVCAACGKAHWEHDKRIMDEFHPFEHDDH